MLSVLVRNFIGAVQVIKKKSRNGVVRGIFFFFGKKGCTVYPSCFLFCFAWFSAISFVIELLVFVFQDGGAFLLEV